MRKYNKLFGIGPAKSGGHSLTEALHLLGVDARHLGSESHYKRDVQHKDTWIARDIWQNKLKNKPLLDGVEGHEAYVDWPIGLLFKLFDKEHPDSLFILTYRNPDDIAASWCRMCYQMKFPHSKPHFQEKADQVRGHYDEVFRYFADRPNRLLILDTVNNDSNMAKLCKFLELPEQMSVQPWPHCFNHQDWYLHT